MSVSMDDSGIGGPPTLDELHINGKVDDTQRKSTGNTSAQNNMNLNNGKPTVNNPNQIQAMKSLNGSLDLNTESRKRSSETAGIVPISPNDPKKLKIEPGTHSSVSSTTTPKGGSSSASNALNDSNQHAIGNGNHSDNDPMFNAEENDDKGDGADRTNPKKLGRSGTDQSHDENGDIIKSENGITPNRSALADQLAKDEYSCRKRVNFGAHPTPSDREYYFQFIVDYLDFADMIDLALMSKKIYLACSRSKLWGYTVFRNAKTLSGHLGPISVLTMFNSWIFSGSLDGKIKLWDCNTWQCKRTLQPSYPPAPQNRLADQVHPGMPNQMTRPPPPPADPIASAITSLTVSGDFLFYGFDSGTVAMHALHRNISNNSAKNTPHKGKVNCLKVAGDKLFSGGDDTKVAVMDPHTLKAVTMLQGHRGPIIGIEIIGNKLFIASEDGNVYVYSPSLALIGVLCEDQIPANQGVRPNMTHKEKLSALCCYERKVYTAGWDCELKVWDAITLRCLNSIFLNPLSICWSLAIRHTKNLPPHLVCSVRDGELELRSADDLYLLPGTSGSNWSSSQDGHESWVQAILPLPDGRIITGSDDWNIKVWHVAEALHDQENYIEILQQQAIAAQTATAEAQTQQQKQVEGQNQPPAAIPNQIKAVQNHSPPHNSQAPVPPKTISNPSPLLSTRPNAPGQKIEAPSAKTKS